MRFSRRSGWWVSTAKPCVPNVKERLFPRKGASSALPAGIPSVKRRRGHEPFGLPLYHVFCSRYHLHGSNGCSSIMRVNTMRETIRWPVDREVQVAPAPSRAPKEGQRGAKTVKRPLPPAGKNQDLRSKTLAAFRLRGSFFLAFCF